MIRQNCMPISLFLRVAHLLIPYPNKKLRKRDTGFAECSPILAKRFAKSTESLNKELDWFLLSLGYTV
jgi:hypothetical protein